MIMKTVKWLGRKPTLIRQYPNAEKVDLKPNQTIEVEQGIATALTHAYRELVYVNKPAGKKKPTAKIKAKVETQDVKEEDVQEG